MFDHFKTKLIGVAHKIHGLVKHSAHKVAALSYAVGNFSHKIHSTIHKLGHIPVVGHVLEAAIEQGLDFPIPGVGISVNKVLHGLEGGAKKVEQFARAVEGNDHDEVIRLTKEGYNHFRG